jgi:hypothetical protein
MKLHHLNNLDEIEFIVHDSFNPRVFYSNKTVSLDTIPFVYLPTENGFDNQAKVTLTFNLTLTENSNKTRLLSYIAEKHFVIELDGNKDFKMLRHSIFDSFITFDSILIRKVGPQLSQELFRKEPSDFDEITFKIMEQIP